MTCNETYKCIIMFIRYYSLTFERFEERKDRVSDSDSFFYAFIIYSII